MICCAIDAFNPDAFHFREALKMSGDAWAFDFQRSAHLHYFSFVTLAALGYGDVTPVSPFARTLSVNLSVAGQLYLTILIARLVGLHITSHGGFKMDD